MRTICQYFVFNIKRSELNFLKDTVIKQSRKQRKRQISAAVFLNFKRLVKSGNLIFQTPQNLILRKRRKIKKEKRKRIEMNKIQQMKHI